ncbi:MAG: secretin N-terminal domain-containing protein [Pararobbsia sp.]
MSSLRGDLATALQEAGVVDAHFPLVVDNAAHTVDVVGPATYVARVRAAAERFERDAGKRVRTAVRVFRLSVANAADKTRVVDGRSLVVPGAATLLRRRFEPAAPPELIELGTRLPAIEADETTNSILIRDTPERIDADGVLVADLDVAPRVVSVQAWVVDLDADALDRLQSALPPAWAHAADGGVPSSFGVAPDGGRALLAQIRALAKDRHARIEVSQTLLTQDRTPAVIDRHEARLAQREDDDSQEDPALDLWLSVQPVVASAGHIGLDVELGRRDDTQHYLRVDEPVAAGECLVIAAPGETSADAPAPARLVLLVPRIAA